MGRCSALRLVRCSAVLAGLAIGWVNVVAQEQKVDLRVVSGLEIANARRLHEGKSVTFFFGPAGPPSGEATALRVRGTVLLYVHRFLQTSIPDTATLEVLLQRKNVAPISWSLKVPGTRGWNLSDDLRTGGLARMLVLSSDEEADVNLRLIDGAEGGPTGRPPYTLVLEAWPVTPGGVVKVTGRPDVRSRPAPRESCKLLDDLDRPVRYHQPVDTLSSRRLLPGLPAVTLVSGGSVLAVRVPREYTEHARTVTVSLFVKPTAPTVELAADGPFVQICREVQLTKETINRTVVAWAPRFDEHAVWRVEVKTSGPPPTAERLIEVVRAKLQVLPRHDGINKLVGLTCFDRKRVTPIKAKPTASVAGVTRLDIELVPTKPAVPKATIDVLKVEMLHAAGVWLRSCLVCEATALSIVSIDGSTFMHADMLAWADDENFAKGTTFTPKQVDDNIKRSLLATRIGTYSDKVLYQQTYGAAELPKRYSNLCRLPSNQHATSALFRVQKAICGSGPGHDERNVARIKVKFSNGQTSCGDDANIIGCRSLRVLTEFNIRDYSFRVQTSPDTWAVVGNGPKELDFRVPLLHEMGHWLGLGDMDSGESIMSPSLERARCIDHATANALARVVSAAVPESAGTPPPEPFTLHRTAR